MLDSCFVRREREREITCFSGIGTTTLFITSSRNVKSKLMTYLPIKILFVGGIFPRDDWTVPGASLPPEQYLSVSEVTPLSHRHCAAARHVRFCSFAAIVIRP